MNKVIGIDLGTGNSCVCVIENGEPIVVANSEGRRTTPSIVSLKDGERKVGESARRQRVTAPKSTVSLIKRFMGVNYDKCSDIIKHVSYDVVNKDGKPRVSIDGREYSPEEISSFIIGKMKQTAEDYLGETVTDAVITCPAWFDNSAREATKLAGEMAGLTVHRIINEPTAAILASDIKTDGETKKIMVADIGCGTTDFSVCEISDGLVEVLASKGDVFLGGSDFDNAIAEWLVSLFKEENNIDLKTDAQAFTRILEAAESAKIELSSASSSEINLPYITAKDGTPLHLVKTLTRAKMEQLTSNLVKKIVKCGNEALDASNLKASDLDSILLVGGQTRSLAIQNALSDAFNVTLNKSVNPDEAVAQGAAIQCNIVTGGEGSNDILLLDVTPVSLGIETMGGVFTKLIEANTTIPTKKEQIFSTAVDNQPAVSIVVLQGERPMAKDNKQIGIFNLDGIAPAPRGVPQIEVSFNIDANGILTVTALDKGTNKEQHITIQDSGSLSEEEIARIKREAEEFAEADKKAKEEVDKINNAEAFVFQVQKSLDDFGDKVTDDEKKDITEKVDALKKALEEKNFTDIDTTQKALQDAWYVVAAKAYGTGEATVTPEDVTPEENTEEETTDAESTEK